MRKLSPITSHKKKEVRRTVLNLSIVLVCVICIVLAFMRFYRAFIDDTLYEERLSQMREVTTQLFAGLEDVVKNQWNTTSEQSRALQLEKPQTLEELAAFMDKQAYVYDSNVIKCKLVAVDESGLYYTQDGRQGLLSQRDYLRSMPEQLSFVSNSMISGEARMVFLKKLETPITIDNDGKQTALIYYGLAQNMEELNPYFNCSAYNGKNSVYVIDSDGLKLFSSSGEDILKGFNVYNVLDNLEYLHGSDFEEAKKELSDNNIAYSNALLGDTEIYYSLYRMKNAAWTLIFLVPSEYVAINTVNLVDTTISLVLLFAIALITISIIAIVSIMSDAVQMAEKASKEAENANKAKSNFLANISHDIRTPMNAIIGITNLMEHDQNNPEKIKTYIHKVQNSSKHLLSLINDVLDMSKIEASEITLNVEPMHITEQISQIDSIIRPQVEEHEQNLTIDVHGIVHEYLLGDSMRFRQIIINLMSNAVKYTQDGGRITIQITEEPSDSKEYATINIVVADNGYGMTPEFMEHIFEPFTRAENSTTNKVQGTGLGMAITKKIVDLMGGNISVSSEYGKGSSFNVKLVFPIYTGDTSRLNDDSDSEDEGSVLDGMRFLCAEDNVMNAQILEATLEINNAACTIYHDGAELVKAFESVRQGEYDAILMDIQMPVMNGLEAAKAIRNGDNPLGKTIPIIAMTANAFSSDVRDCLNAGMDAHVSKPLEISALEKAIKNLNRKRMKQ